MDENAEDLGSPIIEPPVKTPPLQSSHGISVPRSVIGLLIGILIILAVGIVAFILIQKERSNPLYVSYESQKACEDKTGRICQEFDCSVSSDREFLECKNKNQWAPTTELLNK